MSFYTSFFLCRPTKPPIVHGRDLAALILRLREAQVLGSPPCLPMKLKFGRSIDQDAKDTAIYIPVAPGLSTVRDIEWDVKVDLRSLDDIVVELNKHNRSIYRAIIDLDSMAHDIREHMNSTSGHDVPANLHLGTWSFSIEPQWSNSLSADDRFFVGWMSLAMSGNGYMYPLTLLELVHRAHKHPRLVKAANACRELFPVTSEPVRNPLWWKFPSKLRRFAFDAQGGPSSRRVRRIREQMGELWPYDVDAPFEWSWCIHESG